MIDNSLYIYTLKIQSTFFIRQIEIWSQKGPYLKSDYVRTSYGSIIDFQKNNRKYFAILK